MKSLTALTTLLYFTTIKMKPLNTLTTLFYFTIIKMKYLTTLTTLFKFTTIKMKTVTTLITLFKFSTIKIKSLTTLTTLFYFTATKMKSLTKLTTLFYFSTIKMKSLTMLTTLFKFTTINPRYRTTVTTLPLSIKCFSSHQEFQCFHKICMCHSNFTVRKFSGVLHALLLLFPSLHIINKLVLYMNSRYWGKTVIKLLTLPTVCTISATMAAKLKIVTSKLARWHMST